MGCDGRGSDSPVTWLVLRSESNPNRSRPWESAPNKPQADMMCYSAAKGGAAQPVGGGTMVHVVAGIRTSGTRGSHHEHGGMLCIGFVRCAARTEMEDASMGNSSNNSSRVLAVTSSQPTR